MAKSGVAYEVPLDLVAALKNDAFMFSGWKAYHSMREAGINLLNDKGGIKPYELFKKQAGEVFKKQGLNLRAEYQHAVQSSIMATKWSQFVADGERYDLQYRTVGDNKVREAHRQLNGFTAPVTDAFWDSFLPPNGWGCRCTVVQVRKNKYTNSITSEEAITFGKQSTAGDKQQIFRFNPGKQKKIFPPKHPNLPKGCGDCEKKVKLSWGKGKPECKACKIIQYRMATTAKKITANRKEAERLRKEGYLNVQFDETTGALMATHPGHHFDKVGGVYEKNVQQIGYKNGNSVVLENEMFKKQGERSTEGTWNGKLFEVAGCENGTANNIRNGLKHCAKKGETEIAVLYFASGNFDKDILEDGLAKYNGLKKTKGQYKQFDAIICISNNEIVYKKKHL